MFILGRYKKVLHDIVSGTPSSILGFLVYFSREKERVFRSIGHLAQCWNPDRAAVKGFHGFVYLHFAFISSESYNLCL